jgi:hypothetical protein
MTVTQAISFAVAWTRSFTDRIRRDERGEVTEKVILIAVFAALALTVAAIIVTKVTDKANSIPTS